MINNRGLDKVEAQVANAISKGAICHTGGNKIDDFHFEPTLLTNVSDDADCFNSETFGPLCAIKVNFIEILITESYDIHPEMNCYISVF